MNVIQLLSIIVVILLVLQAFGVGVPRVAVSLGWLGLALWALIALLL